MDEICYADINEDKIVYGVKALPYPVNESTSIQIPELSIDYISCLYQDGKFIPGTRYAIVNEDNTVIDIVLVHDEKIQPENYIKVHLLQPVRIGLKYVDGEFIDPSSNEELMEKVDNLTRLIQQLIDN